MKRQKSKKTNRRQSSHEACQTSNQLYDRLIEFLRWQFGGNGA